MSSRGIWLIQVEEFGCPVEEFSGDLLPVGGRGRLRVRESWLQVQVVCIDDENNHIFTSCVGEMKIKLLDRVVDFQLIVAVSSWVQVDLTNRSREIPTTHHCPIKHPGTDAGEGSPSDVYLSLWLRVENILHRYDEGELCGSWDREKKKRASQSANSCSFKHLRPLFFTRSSDAVF